MEHLGSHWTDFHEIWYSSIFRKCVVKTQVLLKSEDQYTFFIHISLSPSWPHKLYRSKHILCSTTFLRKSCRLLGNVEQYCRAGQAADDSMAHAVCMLDTKCYKLTHRICNTYYFSTRTKSHERAAVLRHMCSACIVLYDSFTVFYVNRSNGLVADTLSQMDGGRSIVWTKAVLFCLWAIQGVTGGTDQTSGGCSLC